MESSTSISATNSFSHGNSSQCVKTVKCPYTAFKKNHLFQVQLLSGCKHTQFLSHLPKWQWEIFRLWLESWLITYSHSPVFSSFNSGDFAQPLWENFSPAQWRIALVVQNRDVATFHGHNEVLTAPAETSTLHLSFIKAWLPFRAVGKQAKSLMCSARAALSSPAAAVQGITSCSCLP